MLHLHVHSVYSYKKSIAKIEDIIATEKAMGESSFCITDYGSLTSFVKAFAKAKKENMKFIPGCELLIRPNDEVNKYKVDEQKAFYRKEMRLKRTTEEMFHDFEHKIADLDNKEIVDNHSLIVLAKNDIGFKNLIKIYNHENKENDNQPFLSENSSILENHEGLIILSGGINGEILYWIRNDQEEKAEDLLKQYKNIFGDDFYAQIEYHSMKNLDEVKTFNRFIEIAKKNHIPFVCTNNISYIEENNKAYYRLYNNVMSSSRLKFDEDRNYMIDENELKTIMYDVYPEDAVDEGFANIKLIDNKCEVISPPKAPGLIDSSEELIKLCEEGWKKLRKGTDRAEESEKRYLYELEVINGKNFSQYFIKVLNIINVAKELGILIGPGRGSGCGSEICYLIGITKVDPLKYGLFFERFLNVERGGFPDIDVDMSTVPIRPQEPKIITPIGEFNKNDIIETKSHGNIQSTNQVENILDDEEDIVANSASRNLLVDTLIKEGYFKFFGFIQNEVGASNLVLFKNLAKYYDMPFYEANKISTSDEYSKKLKMKPDKKTKKPWKYDGWLSNACEDFNLDWEDCWDQVDNRMQFCYDLGGIPQNTSIAASGVIMADFDTVLPVHDGIIGFNGSDLESWGYIKYDLLSINTLNCIQYFYGLDVDWNDNNDPNVWKTFQDGDLDFVFQFAGFVPKAMCKEGKPNSIEDLAVINSINRPGPLNLNLNKIWVDIRKGNHEFTDENDIVLSEILKKRYGRDHSGMVIFQEELMSLCQDGSGFSLADADGIRKATGKKIQELMDHYQPQFVENWKYRESIIIDDVGIFELDEIITLTDGTNILAKDLYDKIQNGESFDVGNVRKIHSNPEKIWEQLEDFSKYSFNKSHAVAYSIIGYQTAKIWTYHKEEMLEYMLNYDTKKRYQQAIEKCKELNFKFVFPTLNNMADDKFKVKDETVYVPGKAAKNYNSYVDFLFNDATENLLPLIYMGVCDNLTKDRFALAELATTLLSKPKATALYMEPTGTYFTKLTQILDGLKLAGAVVDWQKSANTIKVLVKRGRGPASIVEFHDDRSEYVRSNLVKYDLKMFGIIRNGIVDDLPYINTTAIEKTLNNIKQRYYDSGKGDYAFKAMQDHLKKYMREYFSNPYRSTFQDVCAVLEDFAIFERSTKLIVQFNDRKEILYVNGANAKKIKAMNKKSLIKMTLVYSPYIARRTESFIFDFDILEIEQIN